MLIQFTLQETAHVLILKWALGFGQNRAVYHAYMHFFIIYSSFRVPAEQPALKVII